MVAGINPAGQATQFGNAALGAYDKDTRGNARYTPSAPIKNEIPNYGIQTPAPAVKIPGIDPFKSDLSKEDRGRAGLEAASQGLAINENAPGLLSPRQYTILNPASLGTPPKQHAAAIGNEDKKQVLWDYAAQEGFQQKLENRDFFNAIAQSVARDRMSAGHDEAHAARFGDAFTSLLGTQGGRSLAIARSGAKLTPEAFEQLRNTPELYRLYDTAMESQGKGGSSSGSVGSSAGNPLAELYGKMSVEDQRQLNRGYFDHKQQLVNYYDTKIAELNKAGNAAGAKQMSDAREAELGHFARFVAQSAGGKLDERQSRFAAGALLAQPEANHAMLEDAALDSMSTGKSMQQSVWDRIKEHPLDAIKQFVTNSDARSLMWDYAKSYASENPGTAALVGGIALISVLGMAWMAMSGVRAMAGGDRD